MKPVVIIGGGLAGLTLGIALRRHEIPVALHEAGSYPRHRVCGEFISGRGLETLARLGLCPLLDRAEAVRASTAAFFSETKSTSPRPLPTPAICLSRFELDAALAQEFSRCGGDLRTNDRWQENFGEGIVRATGRRLQPEENRSRWFGLKIHARNVALTADLEMHLSPRGYVGLCRINGGAVNVCGLFRRRANDSATPKNWREWLGGKTGSPLHRRLATAVFDDASFCAVAGLSLRPQQAGARPECCLGDAITMIPPVTGNGMSMAFESAELAVEPLAAWSRGEISWAAAQQQIARRCDTAFARRLAWAKWLQRAMLTPALQNPLITLAARSDWFWRTAFEQTR
ncbi:MAG: hypothetical protein NTZ16_06780 [Verrucomicrobia bacterium]|nr:hypothetical protein [Verrucomicrobiota bacterium]